MDIGQRIREARKAKGLRQEDLANLINTHRVTLAHVERGQRQPNADFIAAVAKALGLEGEWQEEVEAAAATKAAQGLQDAMGLRFHRLTVEKKE